MSIVMSSRFLLVALLATGCATDLDTSSSDQALKGTVTWAYDSVGTFTWFPNPDNFDNSKCTGTLITPRVVLTAAHCMNFQWSLSGSAQFDLSPTSDGPGIERDVVEWRIFGSEAGPDDLALLRLGSAITSVDPSGIKQYAPAVGGAATLVGTGIHDCPPSDLKQGHFDWKRRMYLFNWGDDVVDVACKGDSGGPVFMNASDDKIGAVASYVQPNGVLRYAHPWKWYTEIQNMIHDVW